MASMPAAPPFKNKRTTLERLEKFISDEYFTDCNLRGQLYGERCELKTLVHVDCGQSRIGFDEAIQKLATNGRQVKPGLTIGPSWSTHWFKAEIVIPSEWSGKTVHFHFDAESEALVWSKNGQPLKGLTSEYQKANFQIASSDGDGPAELYVEVACNTLFGCGKGGMINPPDMEKKFTLKAAELVVFRDDAFRLLMDFEILIGMAKLLPETNPKKYEIMYFANHLVNLCDPTSPESVDECHRKVDEFLRRFAPTNAIAADSFVVHAVGNSHIDTAWLWPYDETKRKCARTFSTALYLMEKYPDSMRFAVSQAQQLEWVRQTYPSLFERIRAKGAEQKFIPVGGCWVEMDGNIPSGESLIRQMLYGQKFFQQYFGRRCTEFWLPDTFGYPSQLPQLMKAAGMHRFVTQKMSWNLVNRFPHHTFWWKGLDGSKVLTHFPPADTYCSRVKVEELFEIEKNFADKGRSRAALMLYGYGDGGGGPDERMLERLQRLKAPPSLPHVRPSTPSEFFESIERNDSQNLLTWSGELYLELHNGTYTTHCDVKMNNRKCEYLLRDCEFISTILWASGDVGESTSRKSWEAEWKNVLLNQFHDVLPGTSIGQVYQDAKRFYDDTISACEGYFGSCGNVNRPDTELSTDPYFVNSLPWTRIWESSTGELHKLPPMGLISGREAQFTLSKESSAEIMDQGDAVILKNGLIQATIDKRTGRVSSLLAFKAGLSIEPGSLFDAARPNEPLNRFVLYDDVPLFWDAWDVMDYHLETGRVCESLNEEMKIVDSGPIRCAVEFSLNIGGSSRMKQRIILRAEQPYLEFKTTIDWSERHKLLKVEFPFNLRTNEATYEIQFGSIKRPAHRNTSWDSAKFEVCAHKWADVSECDFGVALLNDCKYGHSCYDSVLSLSIIRGSTAPDASADLNAHHAFTYALMPHFGPLHRPETGRLSVIQAAYELNSPVRVVQLRPATASMVAGNSWFTIDNPAVMIEAVKVSEEGNAVIVRVYECHGGKARANLSTAFSIDKACFCNLLEEPLSDSVPLAVTGGNTISLALHPFQVQTLCLSLAKAK